MVARKLITIGGSAGAVEGLLTLVPQFPANLDAAICVVIHFPAESPSLLPRILGRRSQMIVQQASQGDPLQAGHVYVAPPDWHLMVEDHSCLLSHGPREHGYRPSIDALFRTAADAYRRSVIGVVLSGGLDDGSSGLRQIRLLGGKCVVQDPSDATFPSMPMNAMAHVKVDRSVPIAEMGEVLVKMVNNLPPFGSDEAEPATAADPKAADDALSVSLLAPPEPLYDFEGQTMEQQLVLRCPECGGVLQETSEAGLPAFRCRVGHNFSLLSLLEAQGMALEQELWSAFNGLLERIDLCRRLAETARENHQHELERDFGKEAEDAKLAADLLRQILLRGTVFRPMPEQS